MLFSRRFSPKKLKKHKNYNLRQNGMKFANV